jgi:plasmid stabilization system protein ParE
MKIVFLAAAKLDLRWFKRYYMEVFPAGRAKADAHFLKTTRLLSSNPLIGQPVAFVEGAREYRIPRTPFGFVYRIAKDAIEVIRILDGRSEDSNDIV